LVQTKQQHVVALVRLGWSLRCIADATAVCRETISVNLKAAGVAVRQRGSHPTPRPVPNPVISGEVSINLVPPRRWIQEIAKFPLHQPLCIVE
jgi:hypothetical protein